MPRRSSASLAVLTPKQPKAKLAPSDDAPEVVGQLFYEIVGSVPADHFKDTDRHLIEQYAQAIMLARQATQELAETGPVVQGRASAWLIVLEKAHRSSVALAARLRLAPQSRSEAKTAARRADGPRPSIYSLMDGADAES